MKVTIFIFLSISCLAQHPWPSFRGPNGSGLSADGNPPLHWDAKSGKNIAFKSRIEGLGHSSPVVWDGRIYLTTAINPDGDPYLKTGLYGESPDNPEPVEHRFELLCLSIADGKVLWSRTAHRGIPKIQRHVKSSHANSTVTTDGHYVVALFGSEGIYCFDVQGQLIWKKDLGLLDAGAFDVPEIRWGYGSSPVIFKDKVIVQCDVNNQSFVAVLDLKSGQEIWRKNRDESAGWGTPTLAPRGNDFQIILNGYKHLGAYALSDGTELWHMKGGGDIPVPRPVLGHDMVFITNAHGKLRPIYAIKLDAEGDISLKDSQTANQYIAWSYPRKGAYLPTPIIHGDYLLIGNDRGQLGCYRANTGQKLFSQRIGGKGSAYTASAVATSSHVYYTSEKGVTTIIKPGETYQQVAQNHVAEPCLATPAVFGDTFLIRTSRHLFGIRKAGP